MTPEHAALIVRYLNGDKQPLRALGYEQPKYITYRQCADEIKRRLHVGKVKKYTVKSISSKQLVIIEEDGFERTLPLYGDGDNVRTRFLVTNDPFYLADYVQWKRK